MRLILRWKVLLHVWQVVSFSCKANSVDWATFIPGVVSDSIVNVTGAITSTGTFKKTKL